MDHSQKEGVGRNKAHRNLFSHAALIALVVFSLIGLSACGNDGDEDASDANKQIAARPDATVSATTGTKISVKAITASNSGQGNATPKNVIDRDPSTTWSAGGPAPQWIQLDLGEETSVSKVRLLASQTPGGATIHQVYAGTSPDELQLIGTLDGATQDNQWLELNISASNVRYLKINTIKSPSWIAWREIEIFR